MKGKIVELKAKTANAAEMLLADGNFWTVTTDSGDSLVLESLSNPSATRFMPKAGCPSFDIVAS